MIGIGFLLKLINPLSRILDTIDRKVDSDVERDKAKLDAVKTWAAEQSAMVNGPGKWLLLFFIAPLGFWFSAVCIYSVLWCRDCAFPQYWTIAALPPPLDEWAGAIVSALFIGGFGVQAVSRMRR